MRNAADEGFGEVYRVAVSTMERSSPRRLRIGVVLLALAALWVVQCGPASAQPTSCTGDCDASGSVTVDELLKGVSIALGSLPLSQCSAFDLNGDGTVTVNEILMAVNYALNGCPTGELALDKISLAVFPGGEETVGVGATDASGNPVDWTAASSDPNVVSVVTTGSDIKVTGVSLGNAAIMVTTQTGVRRSVPVRVYDPMVLDAGEIQIRYTDTFACLPPTAHYYGPVSYYRPVVPEGWQPLGSFAVPQYDCPNINGKQWMITVKENPEQANPITPPLVAPTSLGWVSTEEDAQGRTTSFYVPQCPAGYVAMGWVIDSTDVHDATCIRQDLTVPGVPGGAIVYYEANRVAAPNNSDYTNATAYLATGTFTGPLNYHPVLNVLAIKLPLLIDVPYRNWYPHLTSPARPLASSQAVLAKAILVPFTAIMSGSDYAAKGVGWMVEHSPFVRVERVQSWTFWKDIINASTAPQSLHYSTTTGIDTATSNTYSAKVGISVTVESGVAFLGSDSKISATVSAEFGYSHQTSVSEFTQHTVTVDLAAAPCTYLAVWGLESDLTVKMLNQTTGQLQNIAEVTMSDYADSSATYAYDDYPIPECP